MTVRVIEENGTDLGVEVLADRPDQVRNNLGQRLGPSEGRADSVEPFKVETLLLYLHLALGGADGLPLELHANESGGCGDRGNREDRCQYVVDRVGVPYREPQEGNGTGDHDGHEGMHPPGEEQTRDCGDSEQDRLCDR